MSFLGTQSSIRKHAPKSAPPLTGRRKASILSRFKTRFGSFEEDDVMKNFRARNELLVSKYEDVDEVSHDEFDSLEDEESDFERKRGSNEGSQNKRRCGFWIVLNLLNFSYCSKTPSRKHRCS